MLPTFLAYHVITSACDGEAALFLLTTTSEVSHNMGNHQTLLGFIRRKATRARGMIWALS